MMNLMTNPSRMVARRLMASTMMRQTAFSSDCAPAQKVKTILEEYRRANFSDEVPSRFRKHIIKAIQEPEHPQTFQVDNLNRILKNIGREDAQLSEEELSALLSEAGSHDRQMPLSTVLQLTG